MPAGVFWIFAKKFSQSLWVLNQTVNSILGLSGEVPVVAATAGVRGWVASLGADRVRRPVRGHNPSLEPRLEPST